MNTLTSFICVAMISCYMGSVQRQDTGGKCIKSKGGSYMIFNSLSNECTDDEKWEFVPMTGDYIEIRNVLSSSSDTKCLLVYIDDLDVVCYGIDEETSFLGGTQWEQEFQEDDYFILVASYNSDEFILSLFGWADAVFKYGDGYFTPGDISDVQLLSLAS